MNALSKITLGRALAPTGNSVSTSGSLSVGSPVPNDDLDLSGELGVCELSQEAGSFLPVLKKGVWQNLEGESISTKGFVSEPFELVNPDCRVGIIQTQNGPLTKGYGDAQLAGVDDVAVRVEGAPRAIRYVEPTLGIIVLEQSIQPGSTVEVDYYYTPNPCLSFDEFNNFGFTFNKFGTFNVYSGLFGYDAVFGPDPVTPQPLELGYTYTAWDANYSASLNDPTSLLFNEPAHELTIDPLSRPLEPASVAFEGNGLPTLEGWSSEGPVPATAAFEEGLFLVEDVSTGTNLVDSNPLFYTYTQDLTFGYINTVNFRTKVFEYVADGDFTGVAAGWVGDHYLYKLSFLDVGGIKIAGVLKEGGDETDWTSYLGLTGTVTPRVVSGSSINDRVLFAFEPGYFVGDSIFVGGNVYEISAIEVFEEDPAFFDVRFTTELAGVTGDVQFYRVLPFDQLSSYRMFRNESGETNVFTAGNPAPFVKVQDENLPQQEEIYDLLAGNEYFFGSLSKLATSKSGWDFFRYSVQPTSSLQSAARLYVNGEFNVLPDEDPTDLWTLLDDQGAAQIVDNEFLNIEQAGRVDQGSFTYGRIEPLLTTRAKSDLEALVRVDSFVSDTIPATITIADNRREVTLALFADPALTAGSDYATFRVTGGIPDQDALSIATEGIIAPVDPASVVFQYAASYSGTESFSDEGWTETGFENLITSFTDHHQTLTKSNGDVASAIQMFDLISLDNIYTNYVVASRLRFEEVELDFMNRAPVIFGIDDVEYEVFVSFMDDTSLTGLVFTAKDGSILADILGDPLGFAFDWNNGEFHSYRVVRSEDVVSLFADGVFLGSVTTADLQTSSNTQHEVRLGLLEESVTLSVDYFLSHSTEYAQRKLGFFQGGDINDPTAYETVNVEFLGEFLKIRVTRDPAGKTQVFLNDAALPSFEKQYSELPFKNTYPELNTNLGFIRFGATDPTSLSETVWDYVRYNVTNEREQQLALEHSVFNAAWPVTSAEPLFDTDVEELAFELDTDTTLFFPSKGYNVRKVLSITSEDGVFPYTFAFNETTQQVTLDSPLTEGMPVLVRFIAKAPYSKEYLSNQDPFIKLNEGTPPFELTQERVLVQVEEFVSQLNDFEDLFNSDIDFTYSDGRLRISFEYNEDSFYNCLDLVTRELRGNDCADLTPACDSLGFRAIELVGYEDTYTIPVQSEDGLGSYDTPFYLDRTTSTLDTIDDVLEPFADAEVTAVISDFQEDAYAGASDEALTNAPYAVLTFLEGFVLDNVDTLLDNTANELDDYTENPTDIDYTAPVNFP